MPNRLAGSTSPYLLQHQDNPVDWQPWGDEAFAEARRRDVPVLVSIGYAACHWCHVMAHESFEDAGDRGLPQRALRRGQGRPRGASRRRRGLHGGDQALTGHGGWPMTVFTTPDGRAVLLRHLLPADARGTACRRSASCSRRSRRPGASAATRCVAAGQRIVDGAGRARPGRCRRRVAAAVRRTARRRGALAVLVVRRRTWRVRRRTEVPAVDGARAAAAPPRAHRRRRRAADGRADLRGDGPRRHLRPARRRLRALLGRRRLGGAALREDVVRQRVAAAGLHPPVAGHRVDAGPAGRPGDRRLDAARAADRTRAASPRRWTRTPTASRGCTYAWTPGAARRGAR